MLKQYIKRTKQEIKVGVLVAFKADDSVKVGWSLTNRNAGDAFNEEEGIRIAMERAIHPDVLDCAMMTSNEKFSPPRSIHPDVNIFLERCERYFKDLT
jgi:hypothetical protein